MVVYEQAVTECDQAEAFIHTLLARKGYRVSDNREFFRAPIPEVIAAILALPAELRGLGPMEFSDDILTDEEPAELANLRLQPCILKTWRHVRLWGGRI